MDRRKFNKRLALAGLAGMVGGRLVPEGGGAASPLPPSETDKLFPIEFNARSFRIDGKPVYLYSGEFHYFRVPKRDWRRRMELFKKAGGNCIATCVPWLMHEPEEGRFVFGGADGVHDLEGFLEAARQAGLYVLARPGPYQYAELIYDGLPGWLCENYPELLARNFEGKPFDLATPLVVVSSASMAADSQERLIQFWKQGGKVLLAPVIQTFDESLRPCTVLAQALGSPSVIPSKSDFVRLTVAGVPNIWNNDIGKVFFSDPLPPGAQILGKDELTGKTVAWSSRTESGGEATFLGFRWLHAMQEHARMMRLLLGRLGLRAKVKCSNPNVWTSLRTHGDKSVVFIMNLLSSPMQAEVRCRPSARQGWVDTGRHSLAPMTVKTVEI